MKKSRRKMLVVFVWGISMVVIDFFYKYCPFIQYDMKKIRAVDGWFEKRSRKSCKNC